MTDRYSILGPGLIVAVGLISLAGPLATNPVVAECTFEWRSGNGWPGVDRNAHALAVWDDGNGPALYGGGDFTIAGETFANHIAKWDGMTWSALGSGLEGGPPNRPVVSALAVYNGQLIAGGAFTTAGGVSAAGIAKWDGTSWMALGGGLAGGPTYVPLVSALLVHNGELIAGGSFSTAGGISANGIARWDGTSWSTIGTGLGSSGYAFVYALAIYNNELIAGGSFTLSGRISANDIARWDGTRWLSLGGGIANPYGRPAVVDALTVYNGELIVGGVFWFYATDGTIANNIATWDGTSWSHMGTRWGMSGRLCSTVKALTVYKGELIAGGCFGRADEEDANQIARWNGTSWSPLGSGMNGGWVNSDVAVSALAVYNDELIAAGTFHTAGAVDAYHVARWSGTSWSALNSGIGHPLSALTVYRGELIAGGEASVASSVACWNGTSWSSLGGGLYPDVFALAVHYDGLIAGGGFSSAGSVNANGIARWDGRSWSRLGSGMDGYRVYALTVYNGELIAGGDFPTAGGVSANDIARWNGVSWFPLGSGMRESYPGVRALTVYNGSLIAGGGFATAGGISASAIARWDGATWSPLGSGITGGVAALTIFNGDLIAAGSFSAAGGVNTGNIAKWDGTAWSALGSGMNSTVYALAIYYDELIAGGEFSIADGVSANRIARWNGVSWSPVGDGMGGTTPYPTVSALAVYNDEIVAGGDFTTAGGRVSVNWARWGWTCPRGDMNCDQAINADDIPLFVAGLVDAASLDPCEAVIADVNFDGAQDELDLAAFVAVLLSP